MPLWALMLHVSSPKTPIFRAKEGLEDVLTSALLRKNFLVKSFSTEELSQHRMHFHCLFLLDLLICSQNNSYRQ